MSKTRTKARPKAQTRAKAAPPEPTRNPWPALWALVIGFFMILVDTTIVAVANPAIMARPATPDINT